MEVGGWVGWVTASMSHTLAMRFWDAILWDVGVLVFLLAQVERWVFLFHDRPQVSETTERLNFQVR